jgi:hypothetical protein
MDIQEIKTRIDEFKAIKAKGTITPESLGALLENIVEFVTNPFAATQVLQVNVFDSKTKFVQDDTLDLVLANLGALQNLRIAIQVNYASGTSVLFHATCVKPNYISLHAKAGSCELHLASDGSFTINGTSLW